MCAQTAVEDPGVPPAETPEPPRRRQQQQNTPVQWVGLALLILLFLYQSGFLDFSRGGLTGLLNSRLPSIIALILGITVHEFSHGLVATMFGDDVPRRAGRLTLNPLKHLDPIGTILIFTGPIGWGRPMPINPAGMRNPGLGWAMSSLGGPVSNLVVATIGALVWPLVQAQWGNAGLRYLGSIIVLNAALAVFNLVPLPPLDGFGFVFGLSPLPVKRAIAPVWKFGPFLLLALLFLPGFIPEFPPILSEWISFGVSFVISALGVPLRGF